MKALTFTIELLEPMLATGLEGDPNAGVSLKYIPGSVLRGVVIGFYLRNKNIAELSLDPCERDLFINGRVCYLNTYPESNGKRSLPTPISWQKEKDTDQNKNFFDFSWKKRDCKQYKDLGSAFFVFERQAEIIKVNPETKLTVHTQRDIKKGRSTKTGGAVFRYESVVAGTKFCGAMVGDDTLLEKVKDLISNKEILIGGSRTAGYGRAKVTNANITDWSEAKKPSDEIKKDTEFIVTLLSNALVRDANGQFQSDLSSFFSSHAELIEENTFKRTEIVGGFNRKWGLPLPQLLSIKAGSVFKFKATKDIDITTINTWLEKGIGEKRVEGFGRIAINLNTDPELFFTDSKKIPNTPIVLTNTSELANQIIHRITKQKLEQEIISIIVDERLKVTGTLTNSQISRLRLVLRKSLYESLVKTEESTYFTNKISNFFQGLRQTARNQFDRVRVGNKRFEQWILETIQKQDTINIEPIQIGNLQIEPNSLKQLKLEYHMRLIDSLLAKMAKENS